MSSVFDMFYESFVWTCPRCGERIVGTSREGLATRIEFHEGSHRRILGYSYLNLSPYDIKLLAGLLISTTPDTRSTGDLQVRYKPRSKVSP